MYSGGSIVLVGKASLIDPNDLAPTHPLIFTDGQKMRNLASFSTLLDF